MMQIVETMIGENDANGTDHDQANLGRATDTKSKVLIVRLGRLARTVTKNWLGWH
jgi:hypothetical protein